MNPIAFPFSVLDYGLTALAIIAMAAIVYFFVRFLNSNVKQQQGSVTDALKALAEQSEQHTEVSRGMMNEFYHMANELQQVREQFYVSRKAMSELGDRIDESRKSGQRREERTEHREMMRDLDDRLDEAHVAEHQGWRGEAPKMSSKAARRAARRAQRAAKTPPEDEAKTTE